MHIADLGSIGWGAVSGNYTTYKHVMTPTAAITFILFTVSRQFIRDSLRI